MTNDIEKTMPSPTVEMDSYEKDVVPAERGDEYAGAGNAGGTDQGKLRRSFGTRHVQMIALGANIGSGVYISSGKVRYTTMTLRKDHC